LALNLLVHLVHRPLCVARRYRTNERHIFPSPQRMGATAACGFAIHETHEDV
jgi:hypothetical protein